MKKITTITLMGLFSVLLCANAAIIADYQFVDDASIPDSSDTEAQTTAGSFSAGAGITMGGTSALAPSNRSLMNNNNGFYATDEAGALAGNDYFYFSVQINSGYEVNYSSLSFASLRRPTEGAGAPRAYSLRVYNGETWSIVGSGSVDVAASDDITEPFEINTVDLSGITSLQSTTNQVSFRLYFYDRNTSASPSARIFRIDDVTVEGTVSAVPEPVSAGMLGAGFAVILLLRRTV